MSHVRSVWLLILVCACVSLAGCGGGGSSATQATATPVVVETGSLSGRILDESNHGIANATVEVTPLTTQSAAEVQALTAAATIGSIATVTTGSDGSFTVTGLPSGSRYGVVFSSAGRTTTSLGFSATSENPSRYLEVTLPTGTGKASLELGSPIVLSNPTQAGSSVALTWTRSTATNFEAYEVMRATSPTVTVSSENVKEITRVSTTTTSDSIPQTTVVYCYRVFEKVALSSGQSLWIGSNVVQTTASQSPTATPTPIATRTRTPTPTPIPTSTITPTPSPTATPTPVSSLPPAVVQSFSPTTSNTTITTTIQIEFSGPMNRPMVESSFSVTSSMPTDALTGTASWMGNTIIYTLGQHLGYSRTITVKLEGAKDANGYAIDTLQWSFQTHTPVAATTYPTSSNASPLTVIEVTYPVPMTATSVASGFSITPSVTGTSTWDATRNKLTVTPSSSLASSQVYSVSVTNTQDDAGHSYPNDVAWTFTTRNRTTANPEFFGSLACKTGSSPYYVENGDLDGNGLLDMVVANNGAATISVFLQKSARSFNTAVNYPVQNGPTSVAIADLNKDGSLDVAVTNYNSHSVSVLLNNGDGTLKAAVHYPIGWNPHHVVITDLDGDSKLDLVVASYSYSALCVVFGNGDGTFQCATNYAAGSNPYWVASADLNADGAIDLVVANYGSNSVTVYLGNGNGTFQTGVSYLAGTGLRMVVIADFNGNGVPDLATANYDGNNVSILLGNGDGTFQTAVFYTVASNPHSLAAADINADGVLDLVVTQYNGTAIALLLGNGDGTLKTAQSYATGTNPVALYTGDFNSDTRVDVAVAHYNSSSSANSISVFLNTGTGLANGTGWFAGKADTLTGGTNSRSIVAQDLDGDTKLDLVVANYGSHNVSVFINSGTGTFPISGRTLYAPYTYATNPTNVTCGDVDQDGKCDLIVSCNSGYVSVVPGTGNTTETFNVTATATYWASASPYAATLADFNGDSKPDLATANYGATNMSVLLNKGNGMFAGARPYATNVVNQRTVAIGDFNADGKTDLVTTNSYYYLTGNGSSISVLLGNGDGSFSSPTKYDTGNGNGYYPWGVAVADFNGDGRQELAVANNGTTTITMFMGNGDGTFPAKFSLSCAYSGMTTLCAADLNNDGKMDLIGPASTNDPSLLCVFLGNGDGSFQARSDWPTGLAPYCTTVADMNADGKNDLITVNKTDNTVMVHWGNGDGTFNVSYPTGSGPYGVATNDVNGDGKPDLGVANLSANTVSMLLGNGDGTFSPKVDYATGSAPRSLVVSDVNRDGKADLAIANSGASTLSLLAGNGDGTFASQVEYDVGNAPNSIAVGDLDKDGQNDLVTANYNSNNVSVLLGDGFGSLQPPTNYTVGTSPYAVVIGDVNSDGSPDLMASNLGANTVSVLLGRGTGGFATQVTYSAFPSSNSPTSVNVADFDQDGFADLLVTSNSDTNYMAYLANTGTGAFSAPTVYQVGSDAVPHAVVADLNLDGKPDVVAACGNANAVAILLGNGYGGFASPIRYITGYCVRGVAVGDFNADGLPDIASVSNSNAVSILLQRP